MSMAFEYLVRGSFMRMIVQGLGQRLFHEHACSYVMSETLS